MTFGQNLRLFLGLYVRPWSAVSGIMDEGRLLFAGLAVLLVSVLADPGTAASFIRDRAALQAPTQAQDGAGEEAPDPAARRLRAPPLVSSSSVLTIAALALLYAPAALLLVTLLEPVGSFGVAFRRDFGSLLACTWMTWAAARLPFALAGLAAAPALEGPAYFAASLALWAAGGLYFAALMFVAVRVIFGVGPLSAAVVVAAAPLALLLQPFLLFLVSPFVLYLAYRFFMGDVSDFTRAFGSRQSLTRYLHAATLNPRDGEAHYQLGLIHQQRQQWEEAMARFSRAVEIDPGEIDAHYQLGRIARQQGRHADAIRHFEEVVARDEGFARHEVWREVGGTYLESGSLDHARWALSRYVEQRPHDPEGLYLLGDTLQRLGQAEPSQQAFRQCVEAVDTMPSYRRREVARWRKLAREHLEREGP